MAYTKPYHYTREEQIEAWTADLLADAEKAEAQADSGPFFPERGITPETLRAYAASCRQKAAHPEKSLREMLGGSHGS